MDYLGTSIVCLPMLIGETEGTVPDRTWVVVLGSITTVFLSTRIVPPVSFQFTIGGSLITHAALHIAPVTIYLWRTARTARKTPPLVTTPSAVVWLNDRMTPWIISGISLFANNLCGEFPLIVSVSVIFLSFPSLVQVATNGLLFGSLSSTFLFELSSAE